MSEKFTRRDFALRAAGVAAALAAAPLLKAQETKPDDKPQVSDAEMEVVEKKLAKPMPDEAKKILKDDLSSQKSDTKKRLAFNLPENSEPCFVFIATPKNEKKDGDR
jgi:hypothetical protein